MKKDRKSKNRRILLYIAVAAVIIVALYLIGSQMKLPQITQKYNFSRAANPEYYSLLPPVPSDFNQIQLMWQQGIIREDPDRVNSSYWKQPEWFPLYDQNFVPTINVIAEENRMPIWSLGVFDSQIYSRINQEWLQTASEIPQTSGRGILEIGNDSIIVKHRFWVRAAPGAARIYGVGLYPVYPTSSYLKGNGALGIPNETVIQPKGVENYIKIWAVDNESGSTEFNMGVYWPKLEPTYVREIDVTVEIKKDIPKSIYIAGIDLGAPSIEYQEEQSLKYLLEYTDPNIGMFRGPSEFRLFIDII